jgi:secreted trypsin-like serine protease
MIAPNVVLTAAHCFPSEISGFPVRGAGIITGESVNATFVAGRSVALAPGFSVDQSTGRRVDDAAIIILDRSLDLPVIPLLRSRAASPGETGFVYGYGQRAEGQAGEVADEASDFSTLESGAMAVQDVTENHVFVEYDGSGVNVCFGDSGGPIIVEVNGQPAVAGVVSDGSRNDCRAGDVTSYTNLQKSSMLSFLAVNAPGFSTR